MPAAMARKTALVRSGTPSFEKMLDTWFLTVPSRRLRAEALSRLPMPLSACRKILECRAKLGGLSSADPAHHCTSLLQQLGGGISGVCQMFGGSTGCEPARHV